MNWRRAAIWVVGIAILVYASYWYFLLTAPNRLFWLDVENRLPDAIVIWTDERSHYLCQPHQTTRLAEVQYLFPGDTFRITDTGRRFLGTVPFEVTGPKSARAVVSTKSLRPAGQQPLK